MSYVSRATLAEEARLKRAWLRANRPTKCPKRYGAAPLSRTIANPKSKILSGMYRQEEVPRRKPARPRWS